MASSRWIRQFALGLAAVIVLRWTLVWDMEPVGDPSDANLLVVLAEVWHWGSPKDWLRPPVLSLAAAAARWLNLPWRWIIEAITCGAACRLAVELRPRLGGLVALAAAVAMLFNPYALWSRTEFFREPLFLALAILVGVEALGLIRADGAGRRSVPHLVLMGIWLALLGFTREGELALLLPWVLLGCGLWGVHALGSAAKPWRAAGRGTAAVLALVTPIVLAYVGVTVANKAAWGTPSPHGLASAYFSVLSELHHLGAADASRYAPVTRATFRRAGDLCADFAAEATVLAGDLPLVQQIRADSALFSRRDEIDPSRTLWALDWAASLDLGPAANAQRWAKMQAASACLQRFNQGAAAPWLQRRLPYPFDANLAHWLGSWPLVWLQDTGLVWGAGQGFPAEVQLDRADWNSDGRFDRVLRRRPEHVHGQFIGPAQGVRRALTAVFPGVQLSLCALAVFSCRRWRPLKTGATQADLGLLILACVYLCARTTLYSIITASVAPNVRYQICMMPLACVLEVLVAAALTLAWRPVRP